MFGKIKKYIAETLIELKKVSWLTRRELFDSTQIVLLSAFFLGFYIAIIDFILSRLLGLIIR